MRLCVYSKVVEYVFWVMMVIFGDEFFFNRSLLMENV